MLQLGAAQQVNQVRSSPSGLHRTPLSGRLLGRYAQGEFGAIV